MEASLDCDLSRRHRHDTPVPPSPPAAQSAAAERGAGLEEAAERVVARIQAAVGMEPEDENAGRIVVLEGAGLEEAPVLAALARQLGRSPLFRGRVILFGRPADERLAAALPVAGTPGELMGMLADRAQNGALTSVSFFGSGAAAARIEPVIRELGLSFSAAARTLVALLAAFVPEPLAQELAAGLEQSAGLGRQL